MQPKFIWYLLLTITVTSINAFENSLQQELGDLYFYNEKHEIHFSLSFNDLHNNAKAIRDNLERISNGCTDVFENKNCDFFIQNLNKNKLEIDKDLAYINNKKSLAKRAIFIPLLALGAMIMSLVALLAEQRKIMVNDKALAHANLDNIEKTLNYTNNIANAQSKAIHDIELNMKKLQDRINNNTLAIHKMAEFSDILHMTTLMLFNHQDYMNKISSFYSGEIHKNFFKIVNLDEFSHKISNLDKNLNKNYTLPPVNPIDLIKLSEITSTHNNSHINLIAHIPIADNKPYKLYKLTPIPTQKINETYILNREPELFIQYEKELKIFPTESISKCKNSHNITICNAILQENTYIPSECTISLILESDQNNCTYKEIPSKNYIVHLADNEFYFHILSPISLKLTCKDNIKKFNLTANSLIQLNNQCSITKSSEKMLPKSISFIKPDPHFQPPEISAFDNATNDYIELIPLHNHELMLLQTATNSENTLTEVKKLNEEAKKSMKKHSALSGAIKVFTKIGTKIKNTWSAVTKFFKDIYESMIFVVVSCALIPVILTIVIMILCKINYCKGYKLIQKIKKKQSKQ